jgi:hypothetical protein
VPTSHWAYSAIETLVAAGVISGVGGGQFAPSNPVTRGQLRIMIARSTNQALADAAVPAGNDSAAAPRRAAARALRAVVRNRLNLP